ncbi:MAG TPA: hypothetical protein HPP94_08775 [Desulfuromonadales bacterium]|nr:hypothetical protein [Desulfuromonadales bacterium]
MSNQHSKIDKSMSGQMSLLDSELMPGCLKHLSLNIKQSLSRMLHPRNRALVAAMISEATGIEVRGSVFDKILSSDDQYQPTMIQVIASCKLAGRFDPMEIGLEELGAGILTANEKPFMILAKKIQQRQQLDQEIALLENECKLRR